MSTDMTTEQSTAPSSRRTLSLWLPYLTADRWRRDAGLADKPAETPRVFIEKIAGASRLTAVCARAEAAGLAPGLALADARARHPALAAHDHDRHADARFLDSLADAAGAFTPSVALDLPDGLALDITGCEHLFGGETGLARRLMRALASLSVSGCRLAVAPTPDMSRALARFSRTSPVFAHDDKAVRALPIAALECAPCDATALRRAGLKTIGAVAERPSLLFTARFTKAFTTRLARVLGEEDRRITPRQSPPPLVFDHVCPEPVASLDVCAEIVASLAQRASLELQARGEGGRRFETVFFRTDGALRHVNLETSRPVRDAALLLRLYKDRLEAIADPLDPGFGFDLVRFAVLHAEPQTSRQTSLDAHDVSDDHVAALSDRLSAMFGRERIVRLMPIDTHIPERAQTRRPACEGYGNVRPSTLLAKNVALSSPPPLWGRDRVGGALNSNGRVSPPSPTLPRVYAEHGDAMTGGGSSSNALVRARVEWPAANPDVPRPLTLFETPHPIDMLCEAPETALISFRWRRKTHQIASAQGPERIAEEWWRPKRDFGARDYFRVQTTDGQRFWIFRAVVNAHEMPTLSHQFAKDSTPTSLPPLRGKDRMGGGPPLSELDVPPTLTLPHVHAEHGYAMTGGGNPPSNLVRARPEAPTASTCPDPKWFLHGVFP